MGRHRFGLQAATGQGRVWNPWCVQGDTLPPTSSPSGPSCLLCRETRTPLAAYATCLHVEGFMGTCQHGQRMRHTHVSLV
jgi:hypothetical protein